MSVTPYIVLSAIIFTIGCVGVLTRRNAIVVFMCVELMLNASNLALVAFARAYGDMGGQIFALIVMVVAACEVAVGLGLIVALYRRRLPIDVDELRELLAADVEVYGDGGGKAPQWMRVIVGLDKAARMFAGLGQRFGGSGIQVERREVNGQPGAIFRDAAGQVINVITLDVLDGRIQVVRSVINPDNRPVDFSASSRSRRC